MRPARAALMPIKLAPLRGRDTGCLRRKRSHHRRSFAQCGDGREQLAAVSDRRDGPRHPRRRAPSAGKITPPWAPIVRLPALDNALIVMDRHVEMDEVYSSASSFRCEGEDQSRIWITGVKFYRAPGLDHQPLRDDLENRTGEQAIERFEW